MEESNNESLDGLNNQISGPFNFDDSFEESGLVLGTTFSKNENLASLHLPSHILQTFYNTYRERVDPLMTLLHLPTFWSTLTDSLKNPQDMSRSHEALIFSFYLVTIISLEDDECSSLLEEQKAVMTARYSAATRQALINANLLKSSNLMTLQAYAIFLVSHSIPSSSTQETLLI